MSNLLRDVRRAVRLLALQPGWAAAAIVCLAIGIGINAAGFSVINGLLLRPLPFPDPGRLVLVAVRDSAGAQWRPFALSEYRRVSTQVSSSALLAARTFSELSLSDRNGARMVEGELVSADYFEVLGVKPFLGKLLDGDSDRSASSPEVVLGYSLWRRSFASDPKAIGTVVHIDGVPVTICGVAPPGFVGSMRIVAAEMWLPASMNQAIGTSSTASESEQFGVIGRLRPGASIEQLRAALTVAVQQKGGSRRDKRATAIQATGFGVPPGAQRAALAASVIMFALLGLLTGVATANFGSLLLTRAADRRQEIGIRLALGASVRHIAQQMTVEASVLAAIGGALGIAFSFGATNAIAAIVTAASPQPGHITFVLDISPDGRVIAYALGTALVAAIVGGLWPLATAVRAELIDAVRTSHSITRPSAPRLLRVLVVGQITASTVLLFTAILLGRTYVNTLSTQPGFDTYHIGVTTVDLSGVRHDPHLRAEATEELAGRIRALPGVEQVCITRETPLTFSGPDVRVSARRAADVLQESAGELAVTPEYFSVLGITVLRGRTFTNHDPGRPLAVVVNETMARRLWPAGSALGRTFRVNGESGGLAEVVGVVRDIKYRALTEPARAVFYTRLGTQDGRVSIVFKTRGQVQPMLRSVEREIHATYPDIAIVDNRTMDQILTDAIAPRRQAAIFLTIVCGLALLLAMVGLYGVVGYLVRRRHREFGIRLALGASPRNVINSVIVQAMRVTLLGSIIGLLCSLAAARALSGLLYGVGPYDGPTVLAIAIVFGAIAVLAAYSPARWASRIDPIVTLKDE